ncbi:MAG: hypothetical protein RL318_682 [Fibrobacterota bacterium]
MSQTLTRPYVRLDVFDGPLDLLLYLVHNHELDARTIPVAEIADQYMAFLRSAEAPELGLAGEYLVMAAKLLALKARELLPREEQGELESEEFDFDREELVRRLLEYRRFKVVAEQMRGMEARNAASMIRAFDETRPPKDEAIPEEVVGIWDLLKAFREVLKVKPRLAGHVIEVDDVPIEERMNQVRAKLVREGRVVFDELFAHDTRRIMVVVSFMALMELVKTEEAVFRQETNQGAILVYRRNEERFEEELANAVRRISEDPETNPNIAGLLEEREKMRVESLAKEEAEWGLLSRILEGFADGKVPLDLPEDDEDPDPTLAQTPLGGVPSGDTAPEDGNPSEPVQANPALAAVSTSTLERALAELQAKAAAGLTDRPLEASSTVPPVPEPLEARIDELAQSSAAIEAMADEWDPGFPDSPSDLAAPEVPPPAARDAAVPEANRAPLSERDDDLDSQADTLVLEPGAIPVHVIVPGIGNSGPENWQSILEGQLERVRRVQQRDWDAPFMPEWTVTLDRLIGSLEGEPPILVGHSAGVMTIVHWAMRHQRPVRGALLVAPPDFESPLPEGFPPPEVVAQAGWSPIPRLRLPFPCIVVASENDPFCSLDRARSFADAWGADFVNIGEAGHINSDSGHGPWPFVHELLDQL